MEANYLGSFEIDPRCEKDQQMHWYIWSAETMPLLQGKSVPVNLEIHATTVRVEPISGRQVGNNENDSLEPTISASPHWPLEHSLAMVIPLKQSHRPDGDIFAYFRAVGPTHVTPLELHMYQCVDATKVTEMYERLESAMSALRDIPSAVNDAFLCTGKSVEDIHTLWRSGHHVFEAMHMCSHVLQQSTSPSPSVQPQALDLVNFDARVAQFYSRFLGTQRRSGHSQPHNGSSGSRPRSISMGASPSSPPAPTQKEESSSNNNQVLLLDLSPISLALIDPRKRTVILDTFYKHIVRLYKSTSYPDHFGVAMWIPPGRGEPPLFPSPQSPAESGGKSGNKTTLVLHIFRCSDASVCNDMSGMLAQCLTAHESTTRLCSLCPWKLWNEFCVQLNGKVQEHGSVHSRTFQTEMHVLVTRFASEKMNKSLVEVLSMHQPNWPSSQCRQFKTDAEFCATLFQSVFFLIQRLQSDHTTHQERSSGSIFGVENMLFWAKRTLSQQSLQSSPSRPSVNVTEAFRENARGSIMDESEIPVSRGGRVRLRGSSLIESQSESSFIPSASTDSWRSAVPTRRSRVFNEEASSSSKERVRNSMAINSPRLRLSLMATEEENDDSTESRGEDDSFPTSSMGSTDENEKKTARVRIFQSIVGTSSSLNMLDFTDSNGTKWEIASNEAPRSREEVIQQWKDIVYELLTLQRIARACEALQGDKPSEAQTPLTPAQKGQIVLFQDVDQLVFSSLEQRQQSVITWTHLLNPSQQTVPKSSLLNNGRLPTLMEACQSGVPANLRVQVWMRLLHNFAKSHSRSSHSSFPQPFQRKISRTHNVEQRNIDSIALEYDEEEQTIYQSFMDGVETNYQRLLQALTPHQHAILIDVGRTFPQHSYFYFNGGGQMSLFNLLKAYSLADPQVGYCQGLTFVAGILLLHMDEEMAFQCFLRMMFVLNLRELFMPSMRFVQSCFYQLSRLLSARCPRLFQVLEQLEIPCTLYASPWFLSLFATQLPLPFVVRIFDVIMCFGVEAIFRVGFLLLKHSEEYILQRRHSFDHVCHCLRADYSHLTVEVQRQIIDEAFTLSLWEELQVYSVEYGVMNEADSLFRETQRASLHRELSRFARENSAKVNRLETQVETLQKEVDQLRHRESVTRGKLMALAQQIRTGRSHPDILKEVETVLNILANP